MRSLRRVALVVGAVIAGSGALGALAAGCGGDDTASSQDSGPDVTTDTSLPDVHTDGTAPDTAAPDTGTHADAGDSGNHADASDSGADSGHPDSGDSGHDSGDAGLDAADASDALSALLGFPAVEVNAICARQQNCCQAADGGFDAGGCQAVNFYGIKQATLLGREFIDGGHVQYDAVKAATCLTDIQALACDTSVTSAQWTALFADCVGAITGTQAIGAPCQDTIECAAGEFCVIPTDGGITGSCAALRTAGQPCGDFGGLTDVNGPTNQGETRALAACSFRAAGGTHLTCGEYNPDGGFFDLLPVDQWTCTAAMANTGTCNYNQDCTSLLCANFACATTGEFSPVTCPQ